MSFDGERTCVCSRETPEVPGYGRWAAGCVQSSQAPAIVARGVEEWIGANHYPTDKNETREGARRDIEQTMSVEGSCAGPWAKSFGELSC